MRRKSGGGASPYAIAYDAICEEFIENKNRPLTKSQVQSRLESTPGLRFSPGTTIDEVLGTLKSWKIIAYIQPFRYKERVVVPLERDSSFS